MGTKQSPGKFDAYGKALPDEEYFCLLARDPDFEMFVRMWAHWRNRQIAYGLRPDTQEEHDQITEALQSASEGEIWGRDYRQKKEHQETEFGPPDPADGSRRPLTGQHRRLAKNSTSGANDQ